MTSPPEAEAKQLAAALSELQKRFERLGADEMRLTAGARTLSEGVGLLLEELSGDAEAKPARLGLLCGGLEGLADLLEAYAPGLPAAEDSDAQIELEEDADPMAQVR